MEKVMLIVDGHHGQYVPQIAASVLPAIAKSLKGKLDNIEQDDIKILADGPGHPEYWDAWQRFTAASSHQITYGCSGRMMTSG